MKFYEVQIDSIFLTSDGTAGSSDKCKLSITNVEDLLTSVAGVAIPSITGSPVIQTIPWTSGKQFDIRVNVLNKAQWDALKTLINTALGNSGFFTVTATGDIGDFTKVVKPFPQKPFSAERFKNGRIYNVVLRFITV
jgi:hypothetical protein